MLRLSPARCSCVSQMHSPLCCDLLLRHRPDRYRHLDLNRIYLLRCSLRRCAVVTIASSCTIVAAAPSPAAARHCHCLVARACHGPVACGSVARSGYAQDACACVMQCSHMHSELRLLVRSLHACSGRQRARIAVHALMSVVLARRTGDASAAHEAAEAEAVP